MSRLTRDGTAEPILRDQILRHARGQGNIHFPCSADHEQDWQPYPVDPYSAICDDHTYIHTYIHTVGVNESTTTVSSAWELTSVSMHYSQGNGVHTPLSRACTVPAFSKGPYKRVLFFLEI